MSSYYYFAASLPMLQFEGDLPMSTEEFLSDCERLLSPKDFLYIKQIFYPDKIEGIVGDKVLKAWMEFENTFRNEIAVFRAEANKENPLDFIHGERYPDPWIHKIIVSAAEKDNLLLVEKMLDQLRWQFLDELVAGHYFDLGYLIVYGIKLKILSRYNLMKSSKGGEVFETLKKLNNVDI